MTDLAALHFGTLPDKVATARRLFETAGPALRAEVRVAAGLRSVAARAEELAGSMRRAGLPRLCAECGRGPGGGCCSAGMANEADALLLLANLLLGAEVEPRFDAGDAADDAAGAACCFLGGHGCTLRIKPFFCLNYNCASIRRRGGLEGLLRDAAALLGAYVELEQVLRNELTSPGTAAG